MLHLLDKNIKSNFVDIGTGLRVHYLECNYTNKKDAPVALLLHGFPEISFSWRKIFPLLSKEGFRVIAIDQRGYGKTIGGSKKYEDDMSYFLLNIFVKPVPEINCSAHKGLPQFPEGHLTSSLISSSVG